MKPSAAGHLLWPATVGPEARGNAATGDRTLCIDHPVDSVIKTDVDVAGTALGKAVYVFSKNPK
ncbi:MAG: hypothetical protein WCH43_09990 [Verrucomicrobiota bacterium]